MKLPLGRRSTDPQPRGLAAVKPVPIGSRGSYDLLVEPRHLANSFKDGILPPVFATPYLVLILENAALNAIKQFLEPGESALGTHIDVNHLVATPVGRLVTGHAEVQAADNRKIDFRVWATDGTEEIGAGTHQRTVVTVARLIERMTVKYGSSR
jgi:fluoroacetyl-CoA thioesterase